jgi:hypothetical protein
MRLLNGDRKITNQIKHQFEEEYQYCISTKDIQKNQNLFF